MVRSRWRFVIPDTSKASAGKDSASDSPPLEPEEHPPSLAAESADSFGEENQHGHKASISSFVTWLKGRLGRNGETSLRDSFDEILEEYGEDEAPVAPEGRTLIHNILKVGERTAYDVMVPRVDIVSIDSSTGLEELARLMVEKPHSRYPIYRKDMDDVIGMIHIKDVLAAVLDKGRRFSLKRLLREVLVVAPNLPVLDLLLEMRATRRHMALVVDEYGGIDGLITIEDLVEEIIGDIEDEHDIAEDYLSEVDSEGVMKANARLLLETLEEEIGAFRSQEERAEDIDTLGGLIVYLAGHVPTRGELIVHPESGIEFKVTRADPRRVRTLEVRTNERFNPENGKKKSDCLDMNGSKPHKVNGG